MVKDGNDDMDGTCSAESYDLQYCRKRRLLYALMVLQSCLPITLAPRMTGSAGRPILPDRI